MPPEPCSPSYSLAPEAGESPFPQLCWNLLRQLAWNNPLHLGALKGQPVGSWG